MSYQSFSQIDNEFWFVAPEAALNHGDRPIFLRVSTMEQPASIVLRMPANLSFTPITQNLPPNSTYSFALTPWIDSIENRPPDLVLNKGLLLTSDNLVTAYYEIAHFNNPAIFPLKGKNALGTEFYVVSQNNYPNQVNDGSEAFDIVATEDSTWITITPTLDIVGHVANVSFQIMLNKGETYSARTLNTTATASLAGSHIVSTKPIAVTLSDDSIITGGWDIIGDQSVPVNLLGWKYIAIKGYADNSPPNNNDERVYLLATKDNTDIYLDGGGTPVTTINTGQLFNYGIPPASNTVYIEATEPVYVYHLSGNPGEAGASLLPQDSCTGSKQIGFNRTSSGFFAMLILTRNGNQDSFYLNGNNTIITGAAFTVVPGTGNQWVYYRNSMTTGQIPTGTNLLVNTMGKFHLGILNNVGASSEYGYYSAFSSLYLGTDRSICPGDSVTMDGGPYMTSYEWTKLIGGIWTLIDTNRFLTVTDTGFYACMTYGDFCTLTDTIHIAYYPNATVSLGPDRTICEGTVTIFDPGEFVYYLWNTGITSRLLATDSGGVYWVRVTNNNGCIAYDTVEVFIDSLPKASGPISGPAVVCQGQTGVLYSVNPQPFATSYSWTLPPGASGSSTTNTIAVDFSAGAVSDTIRVTGINSCGPGSQTKKRIDVDPLPGTAGVIAGPSKVCQGQAGVNYSIAAVMYATSYTWLLPPGATIVSGGGTNSITVDFALNATSGDVTVFATNNCGSSNTSVRPITVSLFPQPAGAITGPDPVCQGQTGIIYSVPPITGADSYLWTLPPGAVITAGSGTSAITVSFDSTLAVSGNITVRGHSNDCGDGLPSALALTVNFLPVPAGPISGQNPVCQGQNGVIYSVAPITNATTYVWTVPTGATIVSGNGSNVITVNFSTFALSGTIAVHGQNPLCGNGLSSSFPLLVNPLPAIAGPVSGPTPVCQNQNNAGYSVTPIQYALTYLWNYTGIGANITNNGSSILVNFSTVATSGSFTVTGQNSCGNGPVSPSYPVTVNPMPIVSLNICNQVLTRAAQSFNLRGGIPLGGTYSGTAVTGSMFNPSMVPPGRDTSIVRYTYYNMYGCPGRSFQELSVLPTPLFNCGNNLTDVRDNKVYPTVLLGSQCWMAANLNYGNQLPSSQYAFDNCIPEKYCYNDNPFNCTSDGGLYSWDELMQFESTPGLQGLCPPGWHIPTEADWTVLFGLYINSGFAGFPLKYTGYSGFNALLSGARLLDKAWAFRGFATILWSSDPHGPYKAWAHGMNAYNPSVSYYPSSRSNAFSVRCIRD
jgi:uncharacterized protein (TIGR02145 family)